MVFLLCSHKTGISGKTAMDSSNGPVEVIFPLRPISNELLQGFIVIELYVLAGSATMYPN